MQRIFQPLETETRTTVDTATAAYYLNYSPQTLRAWAHYGYGPLQALRIPGANKLFWRTAQIRTLLGVAK